jgi:hypothetical protein
VQRLRVTVVVIVAVVFILVINILSGYGIVKKVKVLRCKALVGKHILRKIIIAIIQA